MRRMSRAIAAASSTGGHGSVETDTASDFSSVGPAPYSFTFKPDVTAPGDEVASSVPGGAYATLSGTSMSAPHVAGAAAVLQQRHPSWSPAQIKSALMTTGAPVLEGAATVGPLKQGGGRIEPGFEAPAQLLEVLADAPASRWACRIDPLDHEAGQLQELVDLRHGGDQPRALCRVERLQKSRCGLVGGLAASLIRRPVARFAEGDQHVDPLRRDPAAKRAVF